MYLKVCKRKNTDGTTREYLYVVQSYRKGKQVLHRNVGSLGRLDVLQQDGNLEAITESLAKLSEKLEILNLEHGIEAESGTEYGRPYLYRKLWEKLGLGETLRRYFKDKQTSYDISEAILAMVINRLTAPSSKRDIMNWKQEVYEPKWSGLQPQHIYRAMDYLIDEKEAFECELFRKTVDLFNQQLDVVMFDTTSIVHWGEGEHGDLLKHGHSKDRRPDLRQIVVGVLMTKDGIPIAHEVFEGNQTDLVNFPKMIDQLKSKYMIQEVVVVCDKGMMSPDNQMRLHENGYKYILGVRLKGRKADWVDPLLDKTQFKPVIRTADKQLDVQDLIRTETLEYDRDPRTRKPQKTASIQQRYVICYNPIKAQQQAKKREYFAQILERKIPYSSVKSWIKKNGYRKYVDIEGDNIRLKVNYNRLYEEAKYDGMWAVSTNWFDASSHTIVSQYKGLRLVENGFKTLKSDIEIGPMFHWTNRRIRAHVFICFLALILKTSFDRLLHQASPDLNPTEVLHDIKRMNVLSLTFNQKDVHIRTNLIGNAVKAFQAIGAQLPPKFLKLDSFKNVVGTP